MEYMFSMFSVQLFHTHPVTCCRFTFSRGSCVILGTGGLIIKFRACTPARVHAFHVIPTRIECAFLVRGIAGYNQEIFKLERYQSMEFGEDPP